MGRDRFTPLRGEWDSHKHFVLSEDFTYRATFGDITAPAGFVTDFDSVPRLPLAYWLTKGRTRRAPVVHDYLYDVQEIAGVQISRRLADAIFLEAMVDEGVRPAARYAIWLGVRVGGWLPWWRHRRRRH